VQLQLGALDLDIALEIRAGEVVALLGPNGAGKTTLLRALAGLIPVTRGHVHLDGAVLEDSATGTYVPTEKRPIGFVFQDYLAPARAWRGEGLPAGSSVSGCKSSLSHAPASCQAASGSEPRWLGLLRPNLDCSCWTSRWPRSMRAPAPRCGAT